MTTWSRGAPLVARATERRRLVDGGHVGVLHVPDQPRAQHPLRGLGPGLLGLVPAPTLGRGLEYLKAHTGKDSTDAYWWPTRYWRDPLDPAVADAMARLDALKHVDGEQVSWDDEGHPDQLLRRGQRLGHHRPGGLHLAAGQRRQGTVDGALAYVAGAFDASGNTA
jgi:hypothetical protein